MTGTPPRRQTGDRICPVKYLPRVKRTAGLKPPRTRSPWFRHDQLADARRPAQPTSIPTSQLSRAARNEQPESQPPHTRKPEPTQVPQTPARGFDTTHSLTLAGRLNQLQRGQSRLIRAARNEQPESKPPHTRKPEPTQVPQTPARGFDTTHSLTLAGRLNQLQRGQSRLSRAARNEQPESKPSAAKRPTRPRVIFRPW